VALYEMRTYTLNVGTRGDAIKLYGELGWPALKKYENKLVGYFLSDTGTLNQIVHLWKFEDDADRRRHWAAIYEDQTFMAFAGRLRPLILTQENKLLSAAPWGPHP
jgi:NIPSNAP